MILDMNNPWEVLHLACARRGDMALFGDLATINKMVLYIVTQQISLWMRLCVYVCEMHGSDVTITVRARIYKLTLVSVCNDSKFSYLEIEFIF